MPVSHPPPRSPKGERGATARPSGAPPALMVQRADLTHSLTQPESYAGCHARFIAEARALAPNEVIAYPGDARLALANVRTAVGDVLADPAMVARHLPHLSVDRAAEAVDVARAVVHGDMLVQYAPGAAPGKTRDVVKSVAKRRRNMVNAAIGLADKGMLPADEVAKLGRRRGMPGTIDDAIIVTGLFSTHAARIAGMHPYTPKDIDDLRTDAEWLRDHTNPTGTRKPAAKRAGTLEDDRDRLWTLLVRRHALLQRIGGYFHGAELDAHVPALRARVRAASASDVVDDGEAPPAPPTNPVTPH